MRPTVRGFRIRGPNRDRRHDPRITAARPDLADVALAGKLVRPHYAEAVIREVAVVRTPLLAEPRGEAEALSELLLGERFAVLDLAAGWAWGQGLHDGHVGYVEALALAAPAPGERHVVGPSDGLLFRAPTIKAAVAAWIPAGSELSLKPAPEPFLEVTAGPFAGNFLHRLHAAAPSGDWVTIAEGFRGTPYRWGGRTRAGIDCSGLLQIAGKIAGRTPRRDSDLQFAEAGRDVTLAEAARGDVVWWPGHIGVMTSPTDLLHATAHAMTTLTEPLERVAARIAAAGGPPPQLRRLA